MRISCIVLLPLLVLSRVEATSHGRSLQEPGLLPLAAAKTSINFNTCKVLPSVEMDEATAMARSSTTSATGIMITFEFCTYDCVTGVTACEEKYAPIKDYMEITARLVRTRYDQVCSVCPRLCDGCTCESDAAGIISGCDCGGGGFDDVCCTGGGCCLSNNCNCPSSRINFFAYYQNLDVGTGSNSGGSQGYNNNNAYNEINNNNNYNNNNYYSNNGIFAEANAQCLVSEPNGIPFKLHGDCTACLSECQEGLNESELFFSLETLTQCQLMYELDPESDPSIYAGPSCTPDGMGIEIVLFEDPGCTIPSDFSIEETLETMSSKKIKSSLLLERIQEPNISCDGVFSSCQELDRMSTRCLDVSEDLQREVCGTSMMAELVDPVPPLQEENEDTQIEDESQEQDYEDHFEHEQDEVPPWLPFSPSLRFETCTTTPEGGFIVYNSCLEESCSNCQRKYISMLTYIEITVAYRQQQQDGFCQTCAVGCGRASDETVDESALHLDEATEQPSCHPPDPWRNEINCGECDFICMQVQEMLENGYIDATEFIKCQMIYDSEAEQLYAGALCSSAGTKITIGVFSDEDCRVHVPEKAIDEYLVNENGEYMKLSFALLDKAYNSSMSCVDPAEDSLNDICTAVEAIGGFLCEADDIDICPPQDTVDAETPPESVAPPEVFSPSLQFESCATTVEGDFAVFSLCLEKDCDFCERRYAPLPTYAERTWEDQRQRQEFFCAECFEGCDPDSPLYVFESSAPPTCHNQDPWSGSVDCSTCREFCDKFLNMEENGYLDAGNFVSCVSVNVDSDTPLYAAPICAKGGTKILIGAFLDDECQVPDESRSVDNYLLSDEGYQMRLSYALFRNIYSMETSISCVELASTGAISEMCLDFNEVETLYCDRDEGPTICSQESNEDTTNEIPVIPETPLLAQGITVEFKSCKTFPDIDSTLTMVALELCGEDCSVPCKTVLVNLDEYAEATTQLWSAKEMNYCIRCRDCTPGASTNLDWTCQTCGENCWFNVECPACADNCVSTQYMFDTGYYEALEFRQCAMIYDPEDDAEDSIFAGLSCTDDESSLEIGAFLDEACSIRDRSKIPDDYIVSDEGEKLKLDYSHLYQSMNPGHPITCDDTGACDSLLSGAIDCESTTSDTARESSAANNALCSVFFPTVSDNSLGEEIEDVSMAGKWDLSAVAGAIVIFTIFG